jgi:8-oxo-dGTP pyrophosphatase MutT (NUDIX family)
MKARVRKNIESRAASAQSELATRQASAKFLRLSQLRKLRRCEKVAAVCYRVSISGIEFLLVQTRRARWTFPKGSAEPGLTHAQAAALEAFEEAGVHGRMEEASFTRYIRRKGAPNSPARSNQRELAVSAHLCEVLRLGPPQEFDRNPTWFSAQKAKRRLREGRTPDYGAELARVVDSAVARVQRLRSETDGQRQRTAKRDALQRVQFTIIDSGRATDKSSSEIRRNVSQIDDWRARSRARLSS